MVSTAVKRVHCSTHVICSRRLAGAECAATYFVDPAVRTVAAPADLDDRHSAGSLIDRR